ncbi:MAG: NAD(P)-dependent oxidoreductase [Nevskiales bacterium]|nr:NAD(P)-dependent oxidoreductase [Nevskiales bacterium]
MKILVTGSGGRVGRAIHIRLMREHDVVGMDRSPCSTAAFVGDIRDESLVAAALDGVDAVVHVSALHAPHVGMVPDAEFVDINVRATERLATMAALRGARHFVFTSTTALYGSASTPVGRAGWVDETTVPQPRTIYHRSKIEAEAALQRISDDHGLPVTVLRMSRCFPERADLMAVYRLTRGIDYRDVASAHACALERRLAGFKRFIVSGATPFSESDCERLFDNAPAALEDKAPELVRGFERRGWALPGRLDRVYSPEAVQRALGWRPKYGWQSVLDALDTELAEVLPVPAAGS